MNLTSALEEYGATRRRRAAGEEGRALGLALDALKEYLVEASGYPDTESVSPEDLLDFLFDYYPEEVPPDPAVARILTEVCLGFAEWLLERGDRRFATVVAKAESLREEVPRVIEALALLQEHIARNDLGGSVLAAPEDREEAAAELSAGLDRIAALDRIDYAAAEEEYFRVEAVEEGIVRFQSPERDALGEPPLEVGTLPRAALDLLRPGDTLHAEFAPGPAGWELLEVFGIRPGVAP